MLAIEQKLFQCLGNWKIITTFFKGAAGLFSNLQVSY